MTFARRCRGAGMAGIGARYMHAMTPIFPCTDRFLACTFWRGFDMKSDARAVAGTEIFHAARKLLPGCAHCPSTNVALRGKIRVARRLLSHKAA